MASQISFLQEADVTSGKRSQGGITTTDVIVSAYVGGNAEVFPQLLALHVPPGSTIADVTWGKGVFWKNVPEGRYKVLATDLKTGVMRMAHWVRQRGAMQPVDFAGAIEIPKGLPSSWTR